MKKKALIILGGNSRLISKFLEINLLELYKNITIISIENMPEIQILKL